MRRWYDAGVRAIVGITIAAVALAAPARADLPPITSRAYAIDLYDGAALGSARIVGMGGAATASADGSAGAIVNPAAVAVRPATSTDRFDWGFHLDAQRAIGSSDLDNNGLAPGAGSSLTTVGLVGLWREWGLGAIATTQTTALPSAGAGAAIEAQATRGRVSVARTFGADEAITAGVAIDVGTFTIARVDGAADLFTITGSGLAAGAVWRRPRGDWRIGGAASLPIAGATVNALGCDPMACAGRILPEEVRAPWRLATGVARRWGPTPWNTWRHARFRDERAVLVAIDVVISGPTPRGRGLEAFGLGLAQRSGANVVVSARAGAEWEAVPGHVRVRGGAYWEPGRFAGVGGRAHATAGVEVGAIDFHLWGQRRLRASLTGDLAPRYLSAGVSVGFWQ